MRLARQISAATADQEGEVRDLRCHCGSLVARIVDGELEIKCRRCHRIGLIRLPKAGESAEIEISWQPGSGKAKAAK